MTKISYLIVAYRSTGIIQKLLDSIDRQSINAEKEIIVVDNSPDDNCACVASSRPGTKYILNSSNFGYTRGMNQAIAASTGDYMFLLNPDIELSPDCVSTLLDKLDNCGTVAAAPQLLNPDGTIQNSVRNFPTFSTLLFDHLGLSFLFPCSQIFGRWRNLYFSHEVEMEVEQPMASALLIRRDALDKIGPLDEQFFVFFSDVDLCKRIQLAGWKILFVPGAKATHALGGSTRSEGTWLIRDSHRGLYRYLAKHELTGRKAILRPFAAGWLTISGAFRIAIRTILRRSFKQ